MKLLEGTYNNATFSKDDLNNKVPWRVAGAVNTAIDLGHGLASFPSAIGHLGEGSGKFWEEPTLENSAGVFQDLATAASVGAIAASGLPSAKAPIGASRGSTGPVPRTGPRGVDPEHHNANITVRDANGDIILHTSCKREHDA